jgi:hypothetical protein
MLHIAFMKRLGLNWQRSKQKHKCLMPAFDAYAQDKNSYCRTNVLFANMLTIYLVAGGVVPLFWRSPPTLAQLYNSLPISWSLLASKASLKSKTFLGVPITIRKPLGFAEM